MARGEEIVLKITDQTICAAPSEPEDHDIADPDIAYIDAACGAVTVEPVTQGIDLTLRYVSATESHLIITRTQV